MLTAQGLGLLSNAMCICSCGSVDDRHWGWKEAFIVVSSSVSGAGALACNLQSQFSSRKNTPKNTTTWNPESGNTFSRQHYNSPGLAHKDATFAVHRHTPATIRAITQSSQAPSTQRQSNHSKRGERGWKRKEKRRRLEKKGQRFTPWHGQVYSAVSL
jgi:hypothetical protein